MSGTIVPAKSSGVSADIAARIPSAQVQISEPIVAAPRVAPQSFASAPFQSNLSWLQRSGIVLAGLGLTVVALQLGLSAAYAGRILPGVTVAGVDVGGMSRADARKVLSDRIKGYSTHLKISGQTHLIKPEEVGASYDLSETLDAAIGAGRSNRFVPLQLAEGYGTKLSYVVSFDGKASKAFASKLAAASGQQPVDATVVVNNGIPTVQADRNGLALNESQIISAISESMALANRSTTELKPTVQQARIQAVDAEKAVEPAKAILATPITISYKGRAFKPTPAQMGSWLTFTPNGKEDEPGLKPEVNPDGIRQYLQSISPQINQKPVMRRIHVMNGVSQELQPGQDGVELNADELLKSISSAVVTKQPLSVEAPIRPVAFQTQYNNSVALPFDKYIEINLSSQHLWVYQNQQVIYDTPITSGATGAGFPTVTGQFAIQAKQTNRRLVGYQYGPRYNYDVYVKYWMPFHQGYGLHDASWRSAYGGQDYYYGGSHGCVNLPAAAAAWVYNWADVGTPVWVHQ